MKPYYASGIQVAMKPKTTQQQQNTFICTTTLILHWITVGDLTYQTTSWVNYFASVPISNGEHIVKINLATIWDFFL